jgi:hypothetical protein
MWKIWDGAVLLFQAPLSAFDAHLQVHVPYLSALCLTLSA